MSNIFKAILSILIQWPATIAQFFPWFAPIFARLAVGEVFMTSGWGKLNNLPAIVENFISWGIPFPHLLTPFVSGVEFFGGVCIMLGLFTRIWSGMLAVTMIVAIKSALWDQVISDGVFSLDTLLGFSESAYFAIFTWLAIAGAGKISLDALIGKWLGFKNV